MTTQKYDPSKKWVWTPEDKFVLTGNQFGIILNAVRGAMNTPEAQQVLNLMRANEEIEKVMYQAAEDGIIISMPEPGAQAPDMKVIK